MTDSQAPELLPCPFCGDAMEWNVGGYIRHQTQTPGCPIAQSGWSDHLIAGWNRRDHANALIGAAYEDAADACADSTWRHEGEDAYSRGLDRGALEQASTCAAEVRSRTPSDAQSALDRIREEGRVAGLQEGFDAASRAVYDRLYPKNDESDWTEYAKGMASAAVTARNAILALIDQKDQRNDKA